MPGVQGESETSPAAGTVVDDRRAYVLERTSSEVHLLLDNLSASPEISISALAAAHPPTGLDTDWLDQVCRITWPPEARSGSAGQAEQAALLIRAKDYLNSLAKPASGATIAFTLMVTQDEDAGQPGLLGGVFGAPGAASHSRSSLAREAYPDLQQKAREFRAWMRTMGFVLVLILALTCLLSWYAALGNAALADMATADRAVQAAELRVSSAGASVSQRGAGAAPAPVDCARAAARTERNGALAEACMALIDARRVRSQARQGLDTWALFWGNETTARWTLNTLATAVLPVFYGLIGAAAAIVRSLSRKMKGSLLSPRDRQLSLQQLALGAVLGACIGLFIAGPNDEGGTDLALLGPVALSSSAISFVAGFGVEAVFNALEALIGRIFNVAPLGVAPAAPVAAIPVNTDVPVAAATPVVRTAAPSPPPAAR
ncbi:hypothetical protein [Sphingosinicella sp. BN140058]|uniref:hypothetical protein n=1 Tax=Sphingosinicella sp. BN140058 TaxID=1892855 RepID=UPI0010127736|nr:hypothetical protein [Sphingosinicella sp. BN140058]QAY78263.1 hypothetical protein ETR14_18280 [Sphingosinicella sp. BN140058]